MRKPSALELRSTSLCRHITQALVTGGLLLTALPALAAGSAVPDTAPSDSKHAAHQLQEVMVTADKRSERAVDVPMSVAAIDTAQLADQGKVKLADYFTQAPGLTYISTGPGRDQLVIRGITTGTGFNPTVGVTIDDVPFGSSTSDTSVPDLDPSILDHIEVLKGPQGTLYGASSMGGLVKYVTVDPDTSSFYGRIQTDTSHTMHGGTGGGGRVFLNIPLSQHAAMNISLFKRHDQGYVINLPNKATNQSDVEGGRISAIWKPSRRVTVRTAAMFQNTHSDASAFVDVNYRLQPIYGNYAHSRVPSSDMLKGRTDFYDTRVTVDLGWASFDSITGFSKYRQDGPQDPSFTVLGSYLPEIMPQMGVSADGAGLIIDNQLNTNKFSQEFRLTSSDADSPFQWQAGGFFTHEHNKAVQDFNIVHAASGASYALPGLLISNDNEAYKESAIFANVDYRFTDRFDLQIGGRYSRNKITDGAYSGGLLSDPADTSSRMVGHDATYSFSPRYKFSANTTGYIRIASGYRAGGVNPTLVSGIPHTFGSDSLVSYELGFKGDLLDHRLSIDNSVYYIDWSRIQLEQYDRVYGDTYNVNGGGAKSEGYETDVNWIPARNWLLHLGGSYSYAVLTQDLPGYSAGNTAYGKAGSQLPFAPKTSANLSLNRRFVLGSGYTASLGGDATYVGRRLMGFEQYAALPRMRLPGYTTLGLHAGIQGPDWTVTLYMKNLTDRRGFLNETRRNIETAGTDGTFSALLIQPRTVGITASYSF